jgi:hypothetical protein
VRLIGKTSAKGNSENCRPKIIVWGLIKKKNFPDKKPSWAINVCYADCETAALSDWESPTTLL